MCISSFFFCCFALKYNLGIFVSSQIYCLFIVEVDENEAGENETMFQEKQNEKERSL